MAELPNMAVILQKRDSQPWFAVYFFNIAHLCYDQLITVKTRFPLTSIAWPYCGLKFTIHRGHMFLWSWPLTKRWFSNWIVGSCQVNLLKTGQDCSEAGLRIKSKPNYHFCFSRFLFCCFVSVVYIKQRAEEKPDEKVTKLKSKLYLLLG